MSTVSLKRVFQNPLFCIAFGFGSGLSPIAPGTCGTLVAVPLYFILSLFHTKVYLVITLLAFILGIFVCHKVSHDLGERDCPGIVWDEMVGYWLTMFMVPPYFLWAVVGFLLFRLFDIWKPYPITWVEQRVGGGLGIMLDDVLAAVPAFFILQIISHLYTPGAA